MSSFWVLDNISEGLRKLATDLDAGAWAQRHSDVLDLVEYDVGHRLVTTT